MPSTLKRLHGETRPSRLNYREPLLRRTAPRPPADLDPAAKAIWRRTVREMPAGLITAVDADALACYCEAVVRYRQAASLLARSAPLIRGARAGDLPQEVEMARPTGVGRALATYEIPIEGRDEWISAAERWT